MLCECERICQMWSTHTTPQIAAAVGMKPIAVYKLARKMGLPKRTVPRMDMENPSKEQQREFDKIIAERAAEVRAKWTASEEERRLVGNQRPRPYTIPCVTRRQMFPEFQGQGRF